jgi:NhaA family Na+:H+ antiporter
MSLFIANLAFADASLLESAKVGILAASSMAGVVGWVLLRGGQRVPPQKDHPADAARQ